MNREEYINKHFKRNFAAFFLDSMSFPVWYQFISVTLIISLFLDMLGQPNYVVGMVAAIAAIGESLPGLFVFGLIQMLKIKKWYMTGMATVERFTALFLGIALIFAFRSDNARIIFPVFMVAWVIMHIGQGLNAPCYFNVFAKVIPPNKRGVLYGSGGAIGGLIGIWITALVGRILEGYKFPLNFAYIFIIGSIIRFVTIIMYPFVKEPPDAAVENEEKSVFKLKQVPLLLKNNRIFRWYCIVQIIIAFAVMSANFYTVFSIKNLHASDKDIVTIGAISMTTGIIFNMVWGIVSDRFGHKAVLSMGMVFQALSIVFILFSSCIWTVYVAFAMYTIFSKASSISSFNFLLEICPQKEVPAYFSVYKCITVPFVLIAPILGGLAADYFGYRSLFIATFAAAITSFSIMFALVRDPRKTPIQEDGFIGSGA